MRFSHGKPVIKLVFHYLCSSKQGATVYMQLNTKVNNKIKKKKKKNQQVSGDDNDDVE